jgi:hypothetical protein
MNVGSTQIAMQDFRNSRLTEVRRLERHLRILDTPDLLPLFGAVSDLTFGWYNQHRSRTNEAEKIY